jgi:hypothetical protein
MSKADILRAMTTGIMRKKFRISDKRGVFAYSDEVAEKSNDGR